MWQKPLHLSPLDTIMKKPPTPEGIKIRLADLCARSEQCEADIRTKLSRTSLSVDDREGIINFLKSAKFIADDRFARAFARDKVRFSGWGRNKIRNALAAKRIAKEDIEAGLQGIDEKDYLEAIRRAGTAKAKGLDLSQREDSAKFIRHLQARGFESRIIFQLLEALRLSSGKQS